MGAIEETVIFLIREPVLAALLPLGLAAWVLSRPFTLERRRRYELEKAHPEVLGAMAETLKVGLSVEMALAEAARLRSDAMGVELRLMLEEIKNISFEQAYRRFGNRTRVPSIMRVVDLVLVSVSAGVSLADVLTRLSQEFFEINILREERISETRSNANFILWLSVGMVPALIGGMFGLVNPVNLGVTRTVLDLLVVGMFLAGASGVASVMVGIAQDQIRERVLKIPFYMAFAYVIYIAAGLGGAMMAGLV